MQLSIDSIRGRMAAKLLYESYTNGGILGHSQMPEDTMVQGVVKGSQEHFLFLTLTVSLDYQRDADALWESSRQTFADPEVSWLFSPRDLHEKPIPNIIKAMQKYKLSKKPQKDAWIWQTIGVSFYKKWNGDPRVFLAACKWDAPYILRRLKDDTHIMSGRQVYDFPYLRGDKIGSLWLRMLRDNAGVIDLRNMDRVPIPVDVHIARASLMLGVVRGQYHDQLAVIYEKIREAWFQSVLGLKISDHEMIALDVDEPLWMLSRNGCTHRDIQTGLCPIANRCEARYLCVGGRIHVNGLEVELDT